jgi:hypothetical protein
MRALVIEVLEMLSAPSAQLSYEASLTAGHAPTELISGYCDDLFNPKSPDFIAEFSNDELKDLAHLYGLMVESSAKHHPTIAIMLKDPAWRRVVALAKDINERFSRDA